MMHLGDVIREHIDAISDVIATTNNTNVVDDMMWTGVNIVARHDNKNANPIYMDCVNCVTVATDTPTTSKTIITQNAKLVAKFGRIVQTALNIAADAAPTGQNKNA